MELSGRSDHYLKNWLQGKHLATCIRVSINCPPHHHHHTSLQKSPGATKGPEKFKFNVHRKGGAYVSEFQLEEDICNSVQKPLLTFTSFYINGVINVLWWHFIFWYTFLQINVDTKGKQWYWGNFIKHTREHRPTSHARGYTSTAAEKKTSGGKTVVCLCACMYGWHIFVCLPQSNIYKI